MRGIHAAQPNAQSRLIPIEGEPRIVIFALRNIQPDEVDARRAAMTHAAQEITYDYMFALDEADKVPCSCGARCCRGWMN